MVKAIVDPPAPDRRYLKRMGWENTNVINGVAPNGKFPKAVGDGIFGIEGQENGVFDGPMVPNSGTGVFYNDYAKNTTETAQRDLEWQLLRRPGRPLYPGSSARGIVLIGPSMGNNEGENQPRSKLVGNIVASAALIGAAWLFYSWVKRSADEEE